MNENTHTGHRERVRRRVESEGLRALEPHEVIEFLLYYILPRGDVNAAAHRLVTRFGNVSGVLRASVKDLASVEGIGQRTAEYLVRVGRVAEACRQTNVEDRVAMGKISDAMKTLRQLGDTVQTPASYLLCLDMESRLIYRREVTPSLSWGEPETIREMLSDILATRARCAIIALYGAYEIGAYDIANARELTYILRECGVTLLDVVFIAEDSTRSMRREGLIPEIETGAEAKALCEDYLKLNEL